MPFDFGIKSTINYKQMATRSISRAQNRSPHLTCVNYFAQRPLMSPQVTWSLRRRRRTSGDKGDRSKDRTTTLLTWRNIVCYLRVARRLSWEKCQIIAPHRKISHDLPLQYGGRPKTGPRIEALVMEDLRWGTITWHCSHERHLATRKTT